MAHSRAQLCRLAPNCENAEMLGRALRVSFTVLLFACSEPPTAGPREPPPPAAPIPAATPTESPAQSLAPAAPALRQLRYELSYAADHSAILELRLNGAVVLAGREPSTNAFVWISSWVQAGRNVVRARLTPSEPGDATLPRQIDLVVQKALPATKEVVELARLKWPNAQGAKLPAEVELQFMVDSDVPACALFADAEPLDDTPATRKGIAAFARELHAAYARRDAATLQEQYRYKYEDEDRCYGRTRSSDIVLKQFTDSIVASKQWDMAPLGSGDPQLERLPNGRIYRASRGGDVLIRVEMEEGMRAEINVFIARIAGRLTWVR
jgi:hypothetical protein